MLRGKRLCFTGKASDLFPPLNVQPPKNRLLKGYIYCIYLKFDFHKTENLEKWRESASPFHNRIEISSPLYQLTLGGRQKHRATAKYHIWCIGIPNKRLTNTVR